VHGVGAGVGGGGEGQLPQLQSGSRQDDFPPFDPIHLLALATPQASSGESGCVHVGADVCGFSQAGEFPQLLVVILGDDPQLLFLILGGPLQLLLFLILGGPLQLLLVFLINDIDGPLQLLLVSLEDPQLSPFILGAATQLSL